MDSVKSNKIINIPPELKSYNQFIVWRCEERNGKKAKVPYNPTTHQEARTNVSKTWCSYDEAMKAVSRKSRYHGIGFVLTDKDPFAAVDLDKCITDGKIRKSAQKIIYQLGSYSEYSPSGTGVHILLQGKLPKKAKCRAKGIEIYTKGQYITLTGRHIKGTPETVKPRYKKLIEFHDDVFGNRRKSSEHTPVPNKRTNQVPGYDGNDEDLLELARAAANGKKFSQLFDSGDISEYSGDDSAADLALISMLAFWCGPDQERIDRLFRNSALCRPKWTDREKYRKSTIHKALGSRTQFYSDYNLKQQINCIRAQKLKVFEKRELVTRLIRTSLIKMGKFIYTKDGQAYYFFNQKHKLYKLEKDDSQFANLLYATAGLNKAGDDWHYIFNDLLNHALHKGARSTIWRFCHYKKKKLYLSRFNGKMYILDGNRIRTANK